MELEMKHLAAYLPYDLKCKILNHKNDYVGIETSFLTGFYMVGEMPHFTYSGGGTGKSFNELKPILRPLSDVDSDLFEEIGFADEEDFIQSVLDGDIFQKNFDKLVSRHFDVFGLIDSGLAIDVNTLES